MSPTFNLPDEDVVVLNCVSPPGTRCYGEAWAGLPEATLHAVNRFGSRGIDLMVVELSRLQAKGVRLVIVPNMVAHWGLSAADALGSWVDGHASTLRICLTGPTEWALHRLIASRCPSVQVVELHRKDGHVYFSHREISDRSTFHTPTEAGKTRPLTFDLGMSKHVVAMPGVSPAWEGDIVQPDVPFLETSEWIESLVASAKPGDWVTFVGNPCLKAGDSIERTFDTWLEQLKRISYLRVGLCSRPNHMYGEHAVQLTEAGVLAFDIQLTPPLVTTARAEQVGRMVSKLRSAGIKIGAKGSLLTGEEDWDAFRAAWRWADRVGLDFIQIMGATPIQPRGFCLRLSTERCDHANVFSRYASAKTALRAIGQKDDGDIGSSTEYVAKTLANVRQVLLYSLSSSGVMQEEQSFEEDWNWAFQRLGQLLDEIDHGVGQLAKIPKKSTVLRGANPRTAVVVSANNDPTHLTWCLNSMHALTDTPYDVVVVDHGRIPIDINIPANGKAIRIRQRTNCFRSYAVAAGLARVWDYDYIVLMDSNACVLMSDWLVEMQDELNETPDAAVSGINYGGILDHSRDPGAVRLKQHVCHAGWRQRFDHESSTPDDDLLNRLSVPNTSCFNELTGWVQLYRGEVLRRIGLPVIREPLLRRVHWDSEMTLRVQASGRGILHSQVAATKLHYFGERSQSGIRGETLYRAAVKQDVQLLREKNVMFSFDDNIFDNQHTIPDQKQTVSIGA